MKLSNPSTIRARSDSAASADPSSGKPLANGKVAIVFIRWISERVRGQRLCILSEEAEAACPSRHEYMPSRMTDQDEMLSA
jgi:hypothetical protein